MSCELPESLQTVLGEREKQKRFSNISLQKLNEQCCQMTARNKTLHWQEVFLRKFLTCWVWCCDNPHKETQKWLGSSEARNCWQLSYWNNWDLKEFGPACSGEGSSQNFIWWNHASARELAKAVMKLVRNDRLKWREISENLIELLCSGCSHLHTLNPQQTEAKHFNFSVSLRLVMGWEHANCENTVQLTCSARIQYKY